ncbi:MAG: hypothetical protein STSR0008_21050 [Ignavibacterium sp.]
MDNFIQSVNIRKAEEKDVDFIIETIIEAEKSGTDKIVSCGLFLLTEEELRKILKEILLKDVEDYEYSLTGFLVAEYENNLIGALGSWIEELNEVPSSIIKANILIPYLDIQNLNIIKNRLKKLNNFGIKREKGAIQLEYGYVIPEFRRRNVFTKLIKENIKKHFNGHLNPNKVETILLKDNYKSFNCYQKLKFDVTFETKTDDEELKIIFPYATKVQFAAKGNKLNQIINDK